MPFLHILLLGLIQGITEFLPISSDGHLALAGILFDVSEGGLTFTVLLHAGTLLATLLVLRERAFSALFQGLRAFARPTLFRSEPGGQDALFVLVASIPTAVIGLLMRDLVEDASKSPLWIGLGFIGTGFALLATRWARPGVVEHPGLGAALFVGFLQGWAVLPGLSRSGTTIAALLFAGTERKRAFELSMLLSLPAVLGAILLEARKATAAELGPASLGALIAFASGVVALIALRRIVSSGWFSWFAFWVFPLGLATIAMGCAWP